MSDKRISSVISAVFGLTAVIIFIWWFTYNPVQEFKIFVPGLDNRPENMRSEADRVKMGTIYASFTGQPSKLKGYWPRFRGKDYDNISKENIRLEEKFTGGPPQILWSVDVGEGHAGPVVADGKVYLMDYDEEKHADLLRCFSLDDGKEIWQSGYDIYIKRNHGISRTVPAVSGKYVVAMGPKCQVMCVDSDSGKFIWGIDLAQEYDAEVPLWYTGQCPLIDDSLAIIAVGGNAMMIAVNCATGKVVWETANTNNWEMSHSSVIPMTIYGRKMYIYCAIGGIVAVSAEKEDAGSIIFESNVFDHTVVAPSPVYIGDGKIFVTAGYGAGSMMLQVKTDNGRYTIESVQQLNPDEGMASEQQTPVFFNGHLFSILPKDAGPRRNQFIACKPVDCGKIIWSSGKTKRFGLGPYLVADDKFYILSDDGVLTIIKATGSKYDELAEFKILQGQDAWGPMVMVNGRLLARDSRTMVCVDMRAKQ